MTNEPRITDWNLGTNPGQCQYPSCLWRLLKFGPKKPFDFTLPNIMQRLLAQQ